MVVPMPTPPESDPADLALNALHEYLEAIDVLQLAEARVRALKASTAAAFEQTRLPLDLAHDLYWTSDAVEATWIASAAGFPHIRAFLDTVPPIALETPCRICGGPLTVRSRSALRRAPKSDAVCGGCVDRARALRHSDDLARQDRYLMRVSALRAMPYADYLRTEEWQAVRRAAIRRARGACQICNQQRRLDVHHRTYERLGCELPSDVIALCHSCHGLFHANAKLVGP